MDKVVSIIDDSFLQQTERRKFLSIELAPGGFSYCILDADSFMYKVLESVSFGYPLDAENAGLASEFIIQSNELLQNEFDKVSISYISPDFIFIPEDLYSENEIESYVKFNLDLDQNNYSIYSNKLNNLKAYIVYPVPKTTVNMLRKYYPNLRIRHYTTALAESIMYNIITNSNKADIVVNVSPDFFEITVIENKIIKIIKTFKFVTYDDLLYYVFYTLENIGMEAENMNLMLLGNVSIESYLYKTIKLYFNSVVFGGRNDLFKYYEGFDEIPHHYYYTLLNLNICG